MSVELLTFKYSMGIKKSIGLSEKEKVLAELCEKTFLKLWSYPNLYKADGKELCDLFVIFENHAFLFSDRESKKFENPEQDIMLQWSRWKKEVIEKQIVTLEGAKRYLTLQPDKIFLDVKREVPFPIKILPENLIIHKIIVAHGAKEACKNFSKNNRSGSIAIGYSSRELKEVPFPFLVHLNKSDPIHVFDSHNLEIILNELNTVYDFTAYIVAKEEAIKKFNALFYCGEEDLLAHYFSNFDTASNKYKIGAKKSAVEDICFISEGVWDKFVNSKPYKQRKKANEVFQIWDELIQKTCQNAIDGSLLGNGSLFEAKSAIYEMAKEPRFSRRALSENMIKAINDFPENIPGLARNLSFMPSIYKDTAYVFLQVKHPNIVDYDNDYRPKRQAMLELACGVAKNKYPHLNKVIGIGIDAPKFSVNNAEDFILLDCKEWTEELREKYDNENKGFKFFDSNTMTKQIKTISEFPKAKNLTQINKIGRNDPCPCGSGKKYKKCCI